jgi:hypothetical protein
LRIRIISTVTGSASDANKNVATFIGARGSNVNILDNTNIGIWQKNTALNNFSYIGFANALGFDAALIGTQYVNHTSSATANLVFANASSGVFAQKMILFSTGNLLLQNGGTFTDSGQRLQVQGDAFIKGSGATSATNALLVQNSGGTTTLTLNNAGNLGLGVTPSAWATFRALQIGTNYGALSFAGIGSTMITNAFFDGGTYRYLNNDFAAAFEYNISSGGGFVWRQAPSGTAGNAISFTQAMTLNASGDLGLGVSSPSAKLDVVGLGGIRVNEDGAATKVIQIRSNFAGIDPAINVSTNNALLLQTNNTERLRITSGGNLLVGTTTDAGEKFQVNGTARVSGNLTVDTNTLFVDATNDRVGIGTITPSEKLHLAGANVGIDIDGTTSSRTYYNRSGSYIWSTGIRAGDTKYYIYDERVGARLTIDDSGNVGIGTSSPSASAILQADSTTRGFLPPRMTTTQKNAIGTPAAGLQVYDTTLNQMSYYNGTTWINF